jgi:hypothetical protein
MRLARLREPFSDPDWIFDLKHDGFRALAYVEDGTSPGGMSSSIEMTSADRSRRAMAGPDARQACMEQEMWIVVAPILLRQ